MSNTQKEVDWGAIEKQMKHIQETMDEYLFNFCYRKGGTTKADKLKLATLSQDIIFLDAELALIEKRIGPLKPNPEILKLSDKVTATFNKLKKALEEREKDGKFRE